MVKGAVGSQSTAYIQNVAMIADRVPEIKHNPAEIHVPASMYTFRLYLSHVHAWLTGASYHCTPMS